MSPFPVLGFLADDSADGEGDLGLVKLMVVVLLDDRGY